LANSHPTSQVDPDPETMMPTDILAASSKQWLTKLLGHQAGSEMATIQDVIQSEQVRKALH